MTDKQTSRTDTFRRIELQKFGKQEKISKIGGAPARAFRIRPAPVSNGGGKKRGNLNQIVFEGISNPGCLRWNLGHVSRITSYFALGGPSFFFLHPPSAPAPR
ncbi:hypothetical protein EVAR_35943_1 [Eumeta japonica]|uniref:Uncharacterized protein n=1 Tax=Eumeta variegata TaxID=151549 RepID=A0A4C1W6B5_EUMVA|nr:hypothetical protein EVAR_35943_1 [Eumeta japonica]